MRFLLVFFYEQDKKKNFFLSRISEHSRTFVIFLTQTNHIRPQQGLSSSCPAACERKLLPNRRFILSVIIPPEFCNCPVLKVKKLLVKCCFGLGVFVEQLMRLAVQSKATPLPNLFFVFKRCTGPHIHFSSLITNGILVS